MTEVLLEGGLHDGVDELRGEEARRIMNDAYMGSTMAPHPAIRAFMDLSYAGTLAQFKSAMLNTHDVFVSMVNQGVRPTLKALMQTRRSISQISAICRMKRLR